MRRALISCLLLASLSACASQKPEDKLTLTPTAYSAMNGWEHDAQSAALEAFQRSCKAMSGAIKKNKTIGSGLLEASGSDWREACEIAPTIPLDDGGAARRYFEQYFVPMSAGNNGERKGFLTGYYEPILQGSLTRTPRFNQPVYGLPPEAKEGAVSLSRADIDNGALAGRGLEIAWVDDPVALFFAQIQGSARIQLPDGSMFPIGYAGKNNQPYVAIGKTLAKEGVMNKGDVTMITIRQWLWDNPDHAPRIMQSNPSYVFFRKRSGQGEPVGAQGVELTPARSMAVDRRFIPLGMPVFLETMLPATPGAAARPLARLMVAQDVGGAIKGPVRGDFFFGAGEEAELLAAGMKNEARFTLLVPRPVAARLPK